MPNPLRPTSSGARGRPFARLAEESHRLPRPLRVAVVLFHCTWWGLALWSGYRAVWQVQRVEVSASTPVLAPGTVVRARIVTSGRTHGRLRLLLVQGGREALIASKFVYGSRDGALDPRFRRAAVEVALPTSLLARFRPGPARLRAVGLGQSQWLRTPPPVVREAVVAIR